MTQPSKAEAVQRPSKAEAVQYRPTKALLQYRAHKAVDDAVASGALLRPLQCERCRGMPLPIQTKTSNGVSFQRSQIESHHEDYLLPLYVQWLCLRCHKIRHGKEKPQTTESARQIVRRWCANQLSLYRQQAQRSTS